MKVSPISILNSTNHFESHLDFLAFPVAEMFSTWIHPALAHKVRDHSVEGAILHSGGRLEVVFSV